MSVRATDSDGQVSDTTTTDGVIVDLTTPSISYITSSTPNGAYTVGDRIDLTIRFSEPVVLSHPSGTQSIELWAHINTGTSYILGKGTFFTDYVDSVTTTGMSDEGYTPYLYIISPGESINDLNVDSVDLSDNIYLEDRAGNKLTTRTIPTGVNLADNKELMVDTDAPTPGIINDGGIVYSSSTDTLAASWSGFVDTLRGIAY